MGYAEGNTHGFDRADAAMDERYNVRIIDSIEDEEIAELVEHLYYNGYQSRVRKTIPFVDLEVYDSEYYEVLTILDDRNFRYLIT